MTVDSIPAQKSSRILKGTNALLLLLSVILLIAGFPSFLFGVFLAISQRPGGNVEYISPTLGGGYCLWVQLRWACRGVVLIGN